MWDILLKSLIVIGTFLFMEGVAWFTHKYVMHGFLWSWHKSHHSYHNHTLERNDLFALVFSIPAILLFIIGSEFPQFHILIYFAIGITGYGIFYVLFHDILVHQRIKYRYKAKNNYLKRMIHAHYVHHEKRSKEGCEAFGFLYAPKKYEVKQKK